MSGASARSTAIGGVYSSDGESALDAMALNPAGLATLVRPRLDLSLVAGFARGTFTNAANPNGKLNSNGAMPYGAFATRIAQSRFTVGFAALPELLSRARWQYTDAPGGAGNISYGNLHNNSEIMAVRAAAGVGIFLSSRIQIGMTVGAVYNTNTLQTAYVFQEHPALAGLKTLLDLHTSGVGWNGTAGILVRPSSKFEFGGSYRSRTTVASTGAATGNIGIQLAAIGLGGARPDFRYDAEVDNVLPQSALAHLKWTARPNLRLFAQTEWIGWNRAFTKLPVILTNGNNADINGVLGSSGINDFIPLAWKDQFVARVGAERSLTEVVTIRGGYAHANNPIPRSTLSPLTAAITQNTLSAGIGLNTSKGRWDVSYGIDPTATGRVQQSLIKSGEYNNSSVSVQTQMLQVSYSIPLR